MAPTTRNQTKIEPSTPSKSVKVNKERSESAKIWSKIDPTTNMTTFQIVSVGFFAFFALSALLTWLVVSNKINLAGRLNPNDIKSFGARFEFLLRYQCLPLTFLIFMVSVVIHKRFHSPAINPMVGFEHVVQPHKNILQNSFEQYLLSFIAQLGLLCHLSSYNVLRYIPLLNVFFVLGRVLFFVGYPKYRTVGFLFAYVPTMIANGLNLFMLGRFLDFYH